MGIGDRIAQWLNDLGVRWRDTVKSWLVGVLSFGLETFMDVMSRSYAKKLGPLITKLQEVPGAPTEITALLNEIKEPTGEAAFALADKFAGGVNNAVLEQLLGPFLRPYAYAINDYYQRQSVLDASIHLPPIQLIAMRLRGELTEEAWYIFMRQSGFRKDWADALWKLSQVILPTEVFGPVWMRDKAKYESYWAEAKKLGLSDDQLELIKESLYKMPSPQDVVTWLAREVFEPDMVKRYGLDEEWAELEKELFDKIGLREEHALNYWRAHWQHASWSQIIEMLHRGLLTTSGKIPPEPKTPEEWAKQDADGHKAAYDWFRLVEIPPYWRDMLIGTSWATPTRVDIRRWWDMGVVSDDELFSLYHRLGYKGQDAANYVTWTKVYMRAPQLIARYKNGYINSGQVLSELVALGLSQERAQWVFETKIKQEKDTRTRVERDITKAEIVKFYRQHPEQRGSALGLLEAMGLDTDEAEFILAVNAVIPSTSFSEEQKTRIDTARRIARRGGYTKTEEINSLRQIGVADSLARAYANNDQERLAKDVERTP